MPGIFLSSVLQEELVALSHNSSKSITSKISHKLLKAGIVLFLLLIFSFAVRGFSAVPATMVAVPSKHADFLGRARELGLLKAQLLKKGEDRGVNLVGVCGEGGIGKTELAVAFARCHVNDFSMICWIDGSSEESVINSYARLGDHFKIKEENPIRLREKVNFRLENFKGKPWLMVVDDVRDVSYDLPKSGGAILMTCRDKSICSSGSVIELNKNHEESSLLLAKLIGQKKSELIEKLAEKLDDLPLMINIAGHYIAETPGATLSNYSEIISSLMETEESPLKRVDFGGRYPRSLMATYQITLKLLQKKHPLSMEFLRQTKFLHQKNIPAELLSRWLEEKKRYSPAQIALLRGDILRELKNHSLIRYDSERGDFSIHHLLHQVLIMEFKEDVNEVLEVISKFEPVYSYNPTQKDSIRPFQNILPHCMAVLDHVAEPNESAVQLALTIARYFIETEHQLKKGEHFLGLARQWTDAWEHPLKGRVAFLTGFLKFREAEQQKDQSEKKRLYLEALTRFQEALAIFKALHSDELYQGIEQNPAKCTKEYQRAICIQYQGQTLRVLDRLEEAGKVFVDALEAFYAFTGGKEHFDIARILREQALILWAQEKHDEAIEKLAQAIAMQERVYGDSFRFQPTVAATYRTLGDFLLKRGEFAKSDQAYQRAIEINQAIYQTEVHPFLMDLYRLRAEALSAQGETLLAEQMQKKSQDIQWLLRSP